ncbi:MAG: hypothetical protein ACXQS5_06825 [Candidatus Methanospirareceae archaeon]
MLIIPTKASNPIALNSGTGTGVSVGLPKGASDLAEACYVRIDVVLCCIDTAS